MREWTFFGLKVAVIVAFVLTYQVLTWEAGLLGAASSLCFEFMRGKKPQSLMEVGVTIGMIILTVALAWLPEASGFYYGCGWLAVYFAARAAHARR